MNAIDFIAQHFKNVKVPAQECDAVCAFTGKRILCGVPKKIAIKKTFTDQQYLRYQSDFISVEAFCCMNSISYGGNDKFELRKYSFLATRDELRMLQRADVLPLLLSPPALPFVLSFTESNKKHRAFKAQVAGSRERFPVTLDGLTCFVEPVVLEKIIRVLQRWYAILPGEEDKEEPKTWFNQKEMRYGSGNMKKIGAYGANHYFAENEILERYRRAPFFDMLVLCTKKGVRYVED